MGRVVFCASARSFSHLHTFIGFAWLLLLLCFCFTLFYWWWFACAFVFFLVSSFLGLFDQFIIKKVLYCYRVSVSAMLGKVRNHCLGPSLNQIEPHIKFRLHEKDDKRCELHFTRARLYQLVVGTAEDEIQVGKLMLSHRQSTQAIASVVNVLISAQASMQTCN